MLASLGRSKFLMEENVVCLGIIEEERLRIARGCGGSYAVCTNGSVRTPFGEFQAER